MFAPAGMAAKAIAITAFLGGVLSACSDDPSIMDDDSIVVGGFVASPLGSWYADSDEDTLESMDGLAFPPLSVHVTRNFAEDERGVTSPEDDSAYIESVLRTSTGKIVVNYVLEDDRTSVDFETSDIASYDSIFGQTTHDGHVYGVQIYTDLGTDDDPAQRDYVATARWFTYERRPMRVLTTARSSNSSAPTVREPGPSPCRPSAAPATRATSWATFGIPATPTALPARISSGERSLSTRIWMTARSADRSGTFGGSTLEPTVPPGRRSRTRTRSKSAAASLKGALLPIGKAGIAARRPQKTVSGGSREPCSASSMDPPERRWEAR